MEKLLLEIICPATMKRYDFFVSKKLVIREGKSKIIEAICGLEKCEDFLDKNKLYLYNKEDGSVLDEHQTFEIARIQSGMSLMLI